MSGKRPAQATSMAISKNMSTLVFSESAKKQKGKASKLLLDGIDILQMKWPTIPRENQEKVLSVILRFFEATDFQLLTVREHKMLKKATRERETTDAILALQKRQDCVAALKKNLVFGINEVTKGLERNSLSLVVADRSAKPFAFISHIPQLAASTNTPAVALEHLSAFLAPKIGMTSMIAFGFKKNPNLDAVTETVEKLLPLMPEIRTLVGSSHFRSCAEAEKPDAARSVAQIKMENDMDMNTSPSESAVEVPGSGTTNLKNDSVYKPLQILTVRKNENRSQKTKMNMKKISRETSLHPTKRKEPEA